MLQYKLNLSPFLTLDVLILEKKYFARDMFLVFTVV